MQNEEKNWLLMDVLEGLYLLECHLGRLEQKPARLDKSLSSMRDIVRLTKSAALSMRAK